MKMKIKLFVCGFIAACVYFHFCPIFHIQCYIAFSIFWIGGYWLYKVEQHHKRKVKELERKDNRKRPKTEITEWIY